MAVTVTLEETKPTVVERLTGAAGAPIQDGLTRGVIAAALMEVLDLAGVTPEVIGRADTLIVIAAFALFGIYDRLRRSRRLQEILE